MDKQVVLRITMPPNATPKEIEEYTAMWQNIKKSFEKISGEIDLKLVVEENHD